MKLLSKMNNTYQKYAKRMGAMGFVLVLVFCLAAPFVMSPTVAWADDPPEVGFELPDDYEAGLSFAAEIERMIYTRTYTEDAYGNKIYHTKDNFSLTKAISGFATKDNPLMPFALSLVALFFIIETLNKSVSFEKVTIEMVVKLLIRLLIAKILVENAGHIMLQIERIILNSTGDIIGNIGKKIKPVDIGLLIRFSPYTSQFLVLLSTTIGGFFALKDLADLVQHGLLGAALGIGVIALFNAVLSAWMFFDEAGMKDYLHNTLGTTPMGSTYIGMGLGSLNFMIGWLLVSLAAIAIRYIVEGVVKIQIMLTLILRAIELLMLAYLAPIAMAFFVSDEFKATTKKFLINFATICLQGMIIVVICEVMGNLFKNPYWAALGTSYGANPVASFYINIGMLDPWGQHWGVLQPIKVILFSILEPIVVGMLIGKSRAMASTLMGG